MSNDFEENRKKERDSISKAIHLRAAYAIFDSQNKRVSGIKEFTGIDEQADWDGKDFTISVYDPITKTETQYIVDVKFRYTEFANDVMFCFKKTRNGRNGVNDKIGWAFNEEKKNHAILYIREKYNDAIWILKEDLIKNKKSLMNCGTIKPVKGRDQSGDYVQHNIIVKDIDLDEICPNTMRAKYE